MKKIFLILGLVLFGLAQACSVESGVYSKGKYLQYQKKTVHITAYKLVMLSIDLNDGKPCPVLYGIGSGAIISRYGHILTAAHVVDSADIVDVSVYLNQDVYMAKVMKVDRYRDLALLKIDMGIILPHFKLDPVAYIGELVTVVGHPFSIGWIVTEGIVSGLYGDRMTIDAAVNPGNSGGPVINKEGKLIGITSGIITPVGAFAGIGVIVAGIDIYTFMLDFVGIGDFLR